MNKEEKKVGYETLLVDKKRGIGKITMNRPQVLNAISQQMLNELEIALQDMEKDDNVEVIVLTGTGKAFSTGRDMKEVRNSSAPDNIQYERTIFSLHIEDISKPLIAAVNGYCYTGALEIMLSCDLAVAAENATFADTHARYGLLHGAGGTQRLPRLVGSIKAKELLFTCAPITAYEAERIGLLNKVVPLDKLDEEVTILAKAIIENVQYSIKTMKYLINQGMMSSLDTGLDLEQKEYLKYRKRGRTHDTKQKIESFFEKKKNEV
jgi:enoyl-CoA hydratase